MRDFDRLRGSLPFVIALASGIFLYVHIDRLDFTARGGRIGPDVWPKIILAVMLAAAVVGLWRSLFIGSAERDANLERLAGREAESTAEVPVEGASGLRHPLLGVAALLAYVAALSIVGFTPATFALMLTIMWLGGFRRVFRALLISALGTLAFFVIFQRLVYVSLPLGIEPFKSFSTALMALIGVR